MKILILKHLNKNNFISGEKIAKKLGVSRTAVWKQISSLKKVGYEIESIKKKGYRLISKPDIPLPEEVYSDLNTKIVGKKIIYFKKINSTNQFAKELIKIKIPEGTVIVSDIQLRGRGRKNRSWLSRLGGLWFSIILYPHIPPQNSMFITMVSSLSVLEGIKEITGISSEIKWPNDLLINGRKVCGILTELDAEMDRINYTIVGIGINVNNQIDEKLKGLATSLKNEKGSNISRVELLKSILKHVDNNYKYLKGEKYYYIRNKWFENTNIINKKIRIKGEKSVIEGIVKDIDESGCIILKTEIGEKKILTGDIEYI